MLTDIQKIDDWFGNLEYPHNIFTEENYKAEYENLLVGIIGYSSMRRTDTLNKKIVDPQESIQATKSKVSASDTFHEHTINKNICNDENRSKLEYMCYMLTPGQLMAVKDPTSHIIIEGDYGCGKTYVLKERAKQFYRKYPNDNIVYINLGIDRSELSIYKTDLNMMDMIAKNNFEGYNKIDVVAYKDLICHKSENGDVRKYMNRGKRCSMYIQHFLVNSKYNHVFIDEMEPLEKDNEYDFFSTDKTYCVTMKCEFLKDEELNGKWIQYMEDKFNAKRILL